MSFKQFVANKVLPAVNRVAKLGLVKIVPANTPNRDFRGFFSHLRGLGYEFKTVIDVGVAFGSPGLYDSMPRAKFYLVEPVPSCKAVLADLARKLNADTFNVAAGAKDGSMEFFVHPDVSGSSAYRQLEGETLDGEKVTVPVRRLDSIIPADLARPALLKIDTQGAELEVLEGAIGLLDKIDVVIIECSFHQFRAGAPEVHEIVAKMVELGYRCYETLEGHYRDADNAMAQIDIAFVRPDSVLRAEKGFYTQEQVSRLG